MIEQTYCYETGPIRPPSEAASLLVRVTRNCPWNRCEFCTSYRAQPFEIRPAEEVMRDIDRMAAIAEQLTQSALARYRDLRITHEVIEDAQRLGIDTNHAYQVALFLSGGAANVFLQDADSLVADAQDIMRILAHLRRRFPGVSRVTTYARSLTLAKLGKDDLQAIRAAGLTRVHVGLESGSNAVLTRIKKGMLAKHHIQGGQAAKAAGLELSEYVMPGVGGAELSDMHADETAAALNAIDPDFIRLRSFYPLPGSGMAGQLESGAFVPLAEDAIVGEIRRFIAGLEGIGSTLLSDHDRNLLMEVEGRLPDDKAAMLAGLDGYLDMDDERRLLYRIGRRTGAFRLLADMDDRRAYQQAESALAQLRARFDDPEAGLYELIGVRM